VGSTQRPGGDTGKGFQNRLGKQSQIFRHEKKQGKSKRRLMEKEKLVGRTSKPAPVQNEAGGWREAGEIEKEVI